MGKAVLISIRPKWCELIASGKKTIEIRKTKPKLPTPFKCYIYCTKARIPVRDDDGYIVMYEDDLAILNEWRSGIGNPCGMLGAGEEFINGTVIGEFICTDISVYDYDYCTHPEIGMDYDCGDNWFCIDDADLEKACLSYEDLRNYAGNKDAYGWNISDLVIYDKPKELNKFNGICSKKALTDCECGSCKRLLETGIGHCPLDWIKNAPKSWRYVEELTNV